MQCVQSVANLASLNLVSFLFVQVLRASLVLKVSLCNSVCMQFLAIILTIHLLARVLSPTHCFEHDFSSTLQTVPRINLRIFSRCTTGPVGPAGPPGEAGNPGVQGKKTDHMFSNATPTNIFVAEI